MVKLWRFVETTISRCGPRNILELLLVSFILHLLLRILFLRNHVLTLVQENLLHYDFAGANECGYFSCFGTTLCDIPNFKIELDPTHILGTNNWLKIRGTTINAKGTVNQVVFSVPLAEKCSKDVCKVELSKRLFSANSYKAWMCNNMGLKENCDIHEINGLSKPFRLIMPEKGPLPPKVIRGLSPPLTCVSSRLANRFLRRIHGPQSKGSLALKDYTNAEKAEMIFTSALSPATVVQRLFPETEGWLMETPMGTCGLVTVTKLAVKQTIFELHTAPWKERLDVAIQLLDLAHFFTENDSKFMLFIHRLTSHDIGISDRKKLRIANSDNIIIVDKADPQQDYIGKMFEVNHDKLRYKVPEESICRYSESDINYYAVCRYFLSGSWKGLHGEQLEGGLLHDPEELGVFRSEMNVLLDLCTRGSKALPKSLRTPSKSTRRLAAKKLRHLLSTERECGEQYLYRYPECELFDEIWNERVYAIPSFELQWMR